MYKGRANGRYRNIIKIFLKCISLLHKSEYTYRKEK